MCFSFSMDFFIFDEVLDFILDIFINPINILTFVNVYCGIIARKCIALMLLYSIYIASYHVNEQRSSGVTDDVVSFLTRNRQVFSQSSTKSTSLWDFQMLFKTKDKQRGIRRYTYGARRDESMGTEGKSSGNFLISSCFLFKCTVRSFSFG